MARQADAEMASTKMCIRDRLKHTVEEVQTGSAEVRDTFRVPKAGTCLLYTSRCV